MYCSACANPLTPGLSYCNRCGMNLKDRPAGTSVGPVAAFLTAMTLIGICGLGIMLGGALALTVEAKLGEPVVVVFMLMTFLVVTIIEGLLGRQLSRLIGTKEPKQLPAHQSPVGMPNEVRFADQRVLTEPGTSVTENTTRTLEYARKEPLHR